MFIISDMKDQKFPVKAWLSNGDEIEGECLTQWKDSHISTT